MLERSTDRSRALPVLDALPEPPALCAVTGPRRTAVPPQLSWPRHAAVPHGAMMVTGCFALLRALAAQWPPAATPVARALDT